MRGIDHLQYEIFQDVLEEILENMISEFNDENPDHGLDSDDLLERFLAEAKEEAYEELVSYNWER